MADHINEPPICAKRLSRRWHSRAWTNHLRCGELYRLIADELGEDDPRAKAALNACAWTNELVGMLDPDSPKMSAALSKARAQ